MKVRGDVVERDHLLAAVAQADDDAAAREPAEVERVQAAGNVRA